jgi:pimeloyl-ACP methyl ester carboxylesterase
VLVPDLRNHGRSPHSDAVGYPQMAGDVARLLDRLGWGPVTLIGHSMGAKVAMWWALHAPEQVERLVAVDMAPAPYQDRFQRIFAALESVPLAQIANRADAEAHLAGLVDTPAVRQFLLQNLAVEQGRWFWRVNLAGLRRGMAQLLDFPEPPPGRQFTGPALFLYGGRSDYLSPLHETAIRRLFPYARRRSVPGAGHWVYAEQPEAFLRALQSFLGSGAGRGQ